MCRYVCECGGMCGNVRECERIFWYMWICVGMCIFEFLPEYDLSSLLITFNVNGIASLLINDA